MDRFTFCVDFARFLVTGNDLGLPATFTYKQLVHIALQSGFKLCDPWLALYLRILIQDQKPGSSFMVAMEPIRDADKILGIFNLVRISSGQFQLHGNRGRV